MVPSLWPWGRCVTSSSAALVPKPRIELMEPPSRTCSSPPSGPRAGKADTQFWGQQPAAFLFVPAVPTGLPCVHRRTGLQKEGVARCRGAEGWEGQGPWPEACPPFPASTTGRTSLLLSCSLGPCPQPRQRHVIISLRLAAGVVSFWTVHISLHPLTQPLIKCHLERLQQAGPQQVRAGELSAAPGLGEMGQGQRGPRAPWVLLSRPADVSAGHTMPHLYPADSRRKAQRPPWRGARASGPCRLRIWALNPECQAPCTGL